MRIGLTYNAKPTDQPELGEQYAEFDDIKTIHTIRDAIASAGHEVILIEANDDASYNLIKHRPDFVFNIAEGMYGESRESYTPALLGSLKIPFSGSGVQVQANVLNKRTTKILLKAHEVPTPPFRLVRTKEEPFRNNLKYPLIVKPNSEGSSVGITNDSYVTNGEQLKKQIARIFDQYHQPVLVEEYLEGREFTVSILGNENPRVLPIVEIDFSGLPPSIRPFDSYEVKWEYDAPGKDMVKVICPAVLDSTLEGKIRDISLKAYRALECLDFSRVDLRLDSKGTPNVIEINAIPGLIPDPAMNSRFPKACYTAGMTYDQMILAILNTGLKRYNLPILPLP
ncbi:MAG: ATP-grasp domain-containing protein [Candidatus Woesearchaeota archaeon]